MAKRSILPKNPRISITRTVGEWERIEERLEEMQKGNVSSYINNKVNKLANQFKECPDCVTPAEGDKIIKQFCVTNKNTQLILQKISKKIKRPIASLIDELYISPLLFTDNH